MNALNITLCRNYDNFGLPGFHPGSSSAVPAGPPGGPSPGANALGAEPFGPYRHRAFSARAGPAQVSPPSIGWACVHIPFKRMSKVGFAMLSRS